MFLVDQLVSLVVAFLNKALRRAGYSIVETEEIMRLRSAVVASEEELVLCAVSGPMAGQFLPLPVHHTRLLPKRDRDAFPDQLFTAPPPWDVYQQSAERTICKPQHDFCAVLLPRRAAAGRGFTLSNTPAPPRRLGPGMAADR